MARRGSAIRVHGHGQERCELGRVERPGVAASRKATQDEGCDADPIDLLGPVDITSPCPARGILSLDILVVLLVAKAQLQRNIPLVGMLEPNPSISGNFVVFHQGQHDLGYVGVQPTTIDYRYVPD
jgi:hypothetical protein